MKVTTVKIHTISKKKLAQCGTHQFLVSSASASLKTFFQSNSMHVAHTDW